MDSSKRPRPKGLEGRDLEKRPRTDTFSEPSAKDLFDMYAFVRKNAKGMPLAVAKAVHSSRPTAGELLNMLSILRNSAKDIGPVVAISLHDARFCPYVDIPSCDGCWLTCCACKKRKRRCLHNCHRFLKYACGDCLIDMVDHVSTKHTHEIRKYVCTKDEQTGEWKEPADKLGELVQAFGDREDEEMWQKLAATLPKGEGATGEFYIWEERVELVSKPNS